MCSQEMPTISQTQKANELMQKDQWLLNIAMVATTLRQQKIPFLNNGIYSVWSPDSACTDYTRST